MKKKKLDQVRTLYNDKKLPPERFFLLNDVKQPEDKEEQQILNEQKNIEIQKIRALTAEAILSTLFAQKPTDTQRNFKLCLLINIAWENNEIMKVLDYLNKIAYSHSKMISEEKTALIETVQAVYIKLLFACDSFGLSLMNGIPKMILAKRDALLNSLGVKSNHKIIEGCWQIARTDKSNVNAIVKHLNSLELSNMTSYENNLVLETFKQIPGINIKDWTNLSTVRKELVKQLEKMQNPEKTQEFYY